MKIIKRQQSNVFLRQKGFIENHILFKLATTLQPTTK